MKVYSCGVKFTENEDGYDAAYTGGPNQATWIRWASSSDPSREYATGALPVAGKFRGTVGASAVTIGVEVGHELDPLGAPYVGIRSVEIHVEAGPLLSQSAVSRLPVGNLAARVVANSAHCLDSDGNRIRRDVAAVSVEEVRPVMRPGRGTRADKAALRESQRHVAAEAYRAAAAAGVPTGAAVKAALEGLGGGWTFSTARKVIQEARQHGLLPPAESRRPRLPPK